MKNTSRKYGITTIYRRSTTLWRTNWSIWSIYRQMAHPLIDLYPAITITPKITSRINYPITQRHNINSISLGFKHGSKSQNETLRKLRKSTRIWNKTSEHLKNFTSNSNNKMIKFNSNLLISHRKIKDLKFNLRIRKKYQRPKPSNSKKKMRV